MLALSDEVKKWSVIVPTEVLPLSARVAIRRRALARLELAKARATGLLIIGHPKSGNTWLRVQLGHLYQVRHGLPANVVVTSDQLHRRNPAIPRITASNGWYSYEGIIGDKLAVDAPDNTIRHKPIVFLARHPIDIATSWFLQVTKRQTRAKFELINGWTGDPIDRKTVDRWQFVRHGPIGLPMIIDFLNTWLERTSRLERAIMVRYEDLRADPARELTRIGEVMGDAFSADEVEEAVRFGDFENLKQLEGSGYFHQKGMRPTIKGDRESHKVRRAKVRGYREDFTAEQAEELEALVAQRLDPAFGYHDEVAREVDLVAS